MGIQAAKYEVFGIKQHTTQLGITAFARKSIAQPPCSSPSIAPTVEARSRCLKALHLAGCHRRPRTTHPFAGKCAFYEQAVHQDRRGLWLGCQNQRSLRFRVQLLWGVPETPTLLHCLLSSERRAVRLAHASNLCPRGGDTRCR